MDQYRRDAENGIDDDGNGFIDECGARTFSITIPIRSMTIRQSVTARIRPERSVLQEITVLVSSA